MAAMGEIYTSVEINAPVERVWEIFLDMKKFGEWNPFLPKVLGNPADGKVMEFVFLFKLFGRNVYFPLPMKVTRFVPNTELSWCGNVPWLLGIWSYGYHSFSFHSRGSDKTEFSHKFLYFGPLMSIPLRFKKIRNDLIEVQEGMNQALKVRSESQMGI
jgi:uncharacterized protein YndB with AHSA1/START domain